MSPKQKVKDPKQSDEPKLTHLDMLQLSLVIA